MEKGCFKVLMVASQPARQRSARRNQRCFCCLARMIERRPRAGSATFFTPKSCALRSFLAALGSLSFRRSPCIRPNCPACLSGEKHSSYVLYGRQQGHHFSLYVPEELVPQVQRCLDNGRTLHDLLYQAASRNLQALKRARDQASKKGGTERCPGLRSRRSVSPIGSCCSEASCWSHFCRASPIFWTIMKR